MSKNITIKEVLRMFTAALFGSTRAEHSVAASHGIRQKLVLDSINYFLSKTVPGLMGFVSVLVFVRLVGYEQYGHYAVIFAIVMAFASGMAGWLSQGILRFQSQCSDPAELAMFLRSAAQGVVISILIGAAVLGVVIPFSGVQKGPLLGVSLVLFGVLLAYTVGLARFQAGLRSRNVLRYEVTRSIACFLFPVVLMLTTGSRSYWTILLGIALGYLLPLTKSVFVFFSHSFSVSTHGETYFSAKERVVMAKLWGFGWPVALWILCQQGLLVSDRFFIQKFSGFANTGIYSSMYDVVVRSFSLLFMPVTLAVHPLVMDRWNSGNRRQALSTIRSGAKYQLIMFVPIAVVLVATAPWVGRMVLGKTIPGAASLVFPLALGGFLWQTCLLAHKPLEILCKTKRMFAGMLAALAVNVAGNWLLIPKYGYKASAYLTVASSAIYLLSLLLVTPRKEFLEAIESEQEARTATEECVIA